MKMLKSISVIMAILLISIISTSLLESVYAQDTETDYYLVDGEKITLQVSAILSILDRLKCLYRPFGRGGGFWEI